MGFHGLRAGRAAAVALAAGMPATAVPAAGAAAAAPAPRIDLTVLVVDDGGGAVGAIVAELKDTGVPYRTVRVKQLFLGTAVFGAAYAGARSAWTSPELLQSAVTLRLPA